MPYGCLKLKNSMFISVIDYTIIIYINYQIRKKYTIIKKKLLSAMQHVLLSVYSMDFNKMLEKNLVFFLLYIITQMMQYVNVTY